MGACMGGDPAEGIGGHKMSFIVKGVDLPKNYIAVEIKIVIPVRIGLRECHREVSSLFGPEALDNIIQIPKDHGRIVELKDIRYCALSGDGKNIDFKFLLDTQVDALPTILEAEE